MSNKSSLVLYIDPQEDARFIHVYWDFVDEQYYLELGIPYKEFRVTIPEDFAKGLVKLKDN